LLVKIKIDFSIIDLLFIYTFSAANIMKNIAVFTGGYSSEAEVSRKSARTINNILEKENFNLFVIDIQLGGWKVEFKGKEFDYNLSNGTLFLGNDAYKIDFAYIIVHGKPGENGQLQAYLDIHNIEYQTGGHLNMALTFSKKYSTAFLHSMNIPVAKSAFGKTAEEVQRSLSEMQLNYPLFVKPDDGGSSFGVSKVKSENELAAALEFAFKEGSLVMAEEMIVGREFTCGVFTNAGNVTALPVTEIISHNEFFDYAAKYENQSEEVTPAKIDKACYSAMQQMAVRVYEAMNCKGICRVDFISDLKSAPVVIEINAVPGLTSKSIIPQMFAASEYSFEESILEALN
jgi:D-alanine-D-alanine ligase